MIISALSTCLMVIGYLGEVEFFLNLIHLDAALNCVFIYLLFSFADNIYDKGCIKCENLVLKLSFCACYLCLRNYSKNAPEILLRDRKKNYGNMLETHAGVNEAGSASG